MSLLEVLAKIKVVLSENLNRVYLSRRGILILCFRNENMSLLEVVAKIKVVLSENLNRLRELPIKCAHFVRINQKSDMPIGDLLDIQCRFDHFSY